MSDQQRESIEVTCKANMAISFAEGEAEQFDAMKENVEKNGVIIKRWSPEMLNTFKTTWEEVAAEEAGKDAFFKKVYDDLATFRAGYQIWKENAFLPR
jgi:TRAP-type mannitol/chloroaromatic compound transport system substrate-binding protein